MIVKIIVLLNLCAIHTAIFASSSSAAKENSASSSVATPKKKPYRSTLTPSPNYSLATNRSNNGLPSASSSSAHAHAHMPQPSPALSAAALAAAGNPRALSRVKRESSDQSAQCDTSQSSPTALSQASEKSDQDDGDLPPIAEKRLKKHIDKCSKSLTEEMNKMRQEQLSMFGAMLQLQHHQSNLTNMLAKQITKSRQPLDFLIKQVTALKQDLDFLVNLIVMLNRDRIIPVPPQNIPRAPLHHWRSQGPAPLNSSRHTPLPNPHAQINRPQPSSSFSSIPHGSMATHTAGTSAAAITPPTNTSALSATLHYQH